MQITNKIIEKKEKKTFFLTVCYSHFDIYPGDRSPNRSTKRFKSYLGRYELMHIQICKVLQSMFSLVLIELEASAVEGQSHCSERKKRRERKGVKH